MKTQLLTLLAVTALISAFGQTTPPNLTNGLVAFYPFEGNANNSLGNSNNATPGGSYQFLGTGLSGGAIRINGDNSLFYSGGGHVMLPLFGTYMNSRFTFSLWVKDEVLGGYPVNQETYLAFGILDLPKVELYLASEPTGSISYNMDSGAGGPAHTDYVHFTKNIDWSADRSRWKHLVITYEPGRMACYFDSAKIFQTNITYNIFPVTKAALGRHWWDSGSSSSARMSCTYDTVRIWNRALTDQEV